METYEDILLDVHCGKRHCRGGGRKLSYFLQMYILIF